MNGKYRQGLRVFLTGGNKNLIREAAIPKTVRWKRHLSKSTGSPVKMKNTETAADTLTFAGEQSVQDYDPDPGTAGVTDTTALLSVFGLIAAFRFVL